MEGRTELLSQFVTAINAAETDWVEVKIKRFTWSEVSVFPSCYIIPWGFKRIQNRSRIDEYETMVSITIFDRPNSDVEININDSLDTRTFKIIDEIDKSLELQKTHKTKLLDAVVSYPASKSGLKIVATTLVYTATFFRNHEFPS